MWSPWQYYQVTITTLHWRKNNILLNNEHFRTVLGCCNAERPALASRTGAGHELTQLAPQVLFSYQPLNRILPLFGLVFFFFFFFFPFFWFLFFFVFFFFFFFFLYISKKKSTLSNISAAEAGTFGNTVYRAHCATGLKPSPTNAHTHSMCTAPQHQVSLFFLIALFFPLFLLISQGRPCFPCTAKGKVSSTIPLCTAEPWGTSLQNLLL